MFNTVLATVAILALTAGSGLAASNFKIHEIDAQIDLEALGNEASAAQFSSIEADLESALAMRLVDRLADKGVRVVIDISEVELSNGFQEMMNFADTRLAADIVVVRSADSRPVDAFKLTARVNQGWPDVIPMNAVVVSASSATFYDAMINSFADALADRLTN